MDLLATFYTSLSWLGPVLIVLSILVFFHELGHYAVARLNAVRVEVFSIGFGPELFGWTDRHKTRWKVSLIPLGGYVRMFGDADASSAVDWKKVRSLSAEERAETLEGKGIFQRMAVVAAGPFANILVTIFCFWLVFLYNGEPLIDGTITIADSNGPAALAGLRSGDRLLGVDEVSVDGFTHFRRLMSRVSPSQSVIIHYMREGERSSVRLTPVSKDGQTIIGVIPYREPRTAWSALKGAIVGTGIVTIEMLKTFWYFFSGAENPEKIGGLGSIAKMAKDSWEEGILAFVGFMGLLSLNLGILNLFPIPVLDGGHLLFYSIEAIRRKPVSQIIQDRAYKVGFGLLMALMVYSHWNDLVRFDVFRGIQSLITKWF